jgi:hypothetical protein
MKFQKGDRVVATATNPCLRTRGARYRRKWVGTGGVVVGRGRGATDRVRVLRDGVQMAETFHEMFWEKEDA